MLTDKSCKGAFNNAAKPIDIEQCRADLIAERAAYNEAEKRFDRPECPAPQFRPSGQLRNEADAATRAEERQRLEEWDARLTRDERKRGLAFPAPPPAAPDPVPPGHPTLSDEFNKASRR